MYLSHKIKQIWPVKGTLNVIDLGEDYFIVKFSLEENFVKALHEGPLFANGFFLSVRLWEPNFNPKTAITQSAAVWLRLSGLPVEYYDANILKDVGNYLGTLLRIDTKLRIAREGDLLGFAYNLILKNLLLPPLSLVLTSKASYMKMLLFVLSVAYWVMTLKTAPIPLPKPTTTPLLLFLSRKTSTEREYGKKNLVTGIRTRIVTSQPPTSPLQNLLEIDSWSNTRKNKLEKYPSNFPPIRKCLTTEMTNFPIEETMPKATKF
ncbi:hypothetical protein LIER_31589 [Lithospermum erythrorhizon]|uniref:DUF4283 domain-containing protein n=1 Tax=Lithospermum erythrorhizon TaxID=34254 RepID=A0AAV3RXC5_LITER